MDLKYCKLGQVLNKKHNKFLIFVVIYSMLNIPISSFICNMPGIICTIIGIFFMCSIIMIVPSYNFINKLWLKNHQFEYLYSKNSNCKICGISSDKFVEDKFPKCLNKKEIIMRDILF